MAGCPLRYHRRGPDSGINEDTRMISDSFKAIFNKRIMHFEFFRNGFFSFFSHGSLTSERNWVATGDIMNT